MNHYAPAARALSDKDLSANYFKARDKVYLLQERKDDRGVIERHEGEQLMEALAVEIDARGTA
jgi:hypothetical protein